MTENFLNMAKIMNLHIYEVESIPNDINTKKSMLRHTIIEVLKTKDKVNILKVVTEKQGIAYKRTQNSNDSEHKIQMKHGGKKNGVTFFKY